MVKTKVTRDMTNERCLTPLGNIVNQLDVAQHVRATFCTQDWVREHFYMEINECVVMYLDIDQINRPAVPDDVSPVKGILSHYSYRRFFAHRVLQITRRRGPCSQLG